VGLPNPRGTNQPSALGDETLIGEYSTRSRTAAQARAQGWLTVEQLAKRLGATVPLVRAALEYLDWTEDAPPWPGLSVKVEGGAGAQPSRQYSPVLLMVLPGAIEHLRQVQTLGGDAVISDGGGQP